MELDPYKYNQDERSIDFSFNLPPNTRKTDVAVTVNKGTVSCGLKGQVPIVLGEPWGKIEDSLWQIEPGSGSVMVHIDKADVGSFWPCVVRGPALGKRGASEPAEGPRIDPHSAFLLAVMASENRIEGHTKAEQLELLHFAAERNHANALFTLGQIYGKGKETGFDVEQSHEVGLKYYERAANEGHTHAAYWTGYSYRQGLGVAVSDPAKAIVFLEQAAKADMISALFDLGVIYHVGEGVPKDLKKAVEYYEKAAKLGAHPAMYNLGMILMAGEDGVPRDLPRANALLRAARDGNPAQYPLPEQQLAAAEAQAERDAEAVRAALRGVMRGKEEPAGSAASAAKERAAVDGSAGTKNQDADMGQLVLGGAVAMGLCAIGFFAFKQIFGKR